MPRVGKSKIAIVGNAAPCCSCHEGQPGVKAGTSVNVDRAPAVKEFVTGSHQPDAMSHERHVCLHNEAIRVRELAKAIHASVIGAVVNADEKDLPPADPSVLVRRDIKVLERLSSCLPQQFFEYTADELLDVPAWSRQREVAGREGDARKRSGQEPLDWRTKGGVDGGQRIWVGIIKVEPFIERLGMS